MLWLKLSAAPTAVEVKVSIRVPGVSVGVSAPWALFGSLNHFSVIVEPFAVSQTPEPDVAKLVTGAAAKSVSPMFTMKLTGTAVVLIKLSELVLRMSNGIDAGITGNRLAPHSRGQMARTSLPLPLQ